MSWPMYTLLIVTVCVSLVSTGPFCSPRCSRSWDGLQFTNQCTDSTNQSCTGCDTSIFIYNEEKSYCKVNQSKYWFQKLLLRNHQQLILWRTNQGIGQDVVNDGTSTHEIYTFKGVTNMSFTTQTYYSHSHIRFRMFIYVPVANKFGNLTIVVNGINTTHTIDNSFAKYLKPTHDYYLYTTPQIPHYGKKMIVSLFSEGQSGESYNFGLKQISIFGKKCPKNCKSCLTNDSVVVCQQCYSGHFVFQGVCIVECPKGTYSSKFQCLPCNSSCISCDEPGTCTVCSSFLTTPTYLTHDGICVRSCGVRMYQNQQSHTCQPCQIGCLTCKGPYQQNCTSCTSDSEGNPYYLKIVGGCYLDCPPGFLKILNKTFSQNKCDYCSQQCRTCSQSLNNCTSCHGNNIMMMHRLTNLTSCVSECGANYIIERGTCVCSFFGYYVSETNSCVACHPSCKTCFDNHASACKSCYHGYQMVLGASICQSVCSMHEYFNLSSSSCFNCSDECATCDKIPTACTGCSNITYLLNFTCFQVCPSGYQAVRHPNVCRWCYGETYSYNNTCVDTCPPLTRADQEANSCIDFAEAQNQNLLDFIVIPSFINNGAQLCLQLLFKTKLMLIHEADSKVSVILTELKSQRLLADSPKALNVTNVEFDESLFNLKIFVDLPELFKSKLSAGNNQILINFKNGSLVTENGTLMTQLKSIPTNNPGFIRSLYNTFYSSNLIIIGILFSIIGLALIPFSYFKKFTYYPILEFLLQLQLIGLIGFTMYPTQFQTFTFLKGFDVSLLQWIPNIVNSITMSPFTENSFDAYQFKSSTMNFLSLSASNLLFLLIFQPVLGYLSLYDKVKFSKFILWTEKTLIYICSTNILFAATSSFLSLSINTQNLSAFFIISQLLGFIAIGCIFYFFTVQRKQFKIYKIFFMTSLAYCIFVPLFSKSFYLCLTVLNLVQIGIIVATYVNSKKSDQRTKLLMIGRVLFLALFNIIELGYYSELIISVGSLIVSTELGIVSYIIYLSYEKKKLPIRKDSIKNIDIKDQVKQNCFKISEEFSKDQIIKITDNKPDDVVDEDQDYGYEEITEVSLRKKSSSRKNSKTFSPGKNWRAYNKNKSNTVYKEEEIVNNNQETEIVSPTYQSIRPPKTRQNTGKV